jgi:hypothetical protein
MLTNSFRAFIAILSLSFFAALTSADDFTPLPFSVTIGGQAAAVKGDASKTAHATIEKPVVANASLEVGAKGDMTIINVVAANDQGTPNDGATPAIIVIQNSNKTTLDKTMDGKKLASGNYLLAAVAEGKTASVLFKVQ